MAKPSLFSIDDDLTDQGYEGVAAQVLNFKLRSTVGVRSAQLQVWDANAFNPELGDILENPPRSSPSAPALTLSNGTATGQAVDFSPLSGEITCTLPSGVTASWLVRCVINGGQRVVNGVVVRDPNLIHERMVVIRSGAGLRQLVATETRQQSDHGVAQWAEEVLAALGSVATSSAGDWKPSVRVATTASLPAYNRVGNVITGTANGTVPSATTDSTATQAGDRVLLLHGAAPEDNGIYDVSQAGVAGGGGSPFIWTRAEDADSSAKVTPGMRVPVEEGTINAARVFKLITIGAIVLNTTGLSFSRENDLPNGTTVDQIAKWDGSGWIAGALNLAAAAAVSGILALANGGTGGTPGAGQVVGSSGWTATPTVTSVTHGASADAGSVLSSTALTWGKSVAAPGLLQAARDSDAAPQALTFAPQAPFATATGTNRVPGSFVVALAAPTNGGTTEGRLSVTRGGAQVASIGPLDSAPTSFGAVWLTPAAPTTSNFVLAASTTNTTVNTPTTLTLAIGNNAYFQLNTSQISVYSPTLAWGAAVATPTVTQTTPGSDVATNILTIQSQSAWASATGTNRNGAHLDLKAGTKASGGTDGQVRIYSGSGWLGAQISYGQVSLYGSTEIDFFMGGTFRTLLDGSAWRLKNGCHLRWDNENTAPEIAHSGHTTDSAPGNLTLKPQAPWASATGANRTPGSLLVDLSAPTGGSTTEGFFTVRRASVTHWLAGAYPSAPSSYSVLYGGPGVSQSGNNYTLLVTSTSTWLNTPDVAGTLNLLNGNSSRIAITTALVTFVPPTLAWAMGVVSPTFTQSTPTSDVATNDLTIQAQSPWASATTNNKGGKLWLRGGNAGTGEGNAPGSVWIGAGATTVASFEAAQVSLYAIYLEFRHDAASPEIRQQARQSDLATYNLLIQAQSAYSGATTNKDGGHVVIKGGARYTSGTDGGVQLKGGDGTTVFQIDMAGGARIGFYGATPAAKPTVTGSRGGNAALASLLTALSGQGLLTDSSSA